MAKIFLTSAVIFFYSSSLFGQRWDNETLCSTDTLIAEPYTARKYDFGKLNNLDQKPYKFVQCRTRSDIGFRVELGFSNYYYGERTTKWIGQHEGPNFNFILAIDKWNFGFRFKPWTIEPRKEMEFNGQTLPTSAKLNSIKLDYYVGYSFDFNRLISVEPYIGYNRSSFIVINEDELNQEFTFDKTGGLLIGTTLNKYFKMKEYDYLSIFGTVGYGVVNYKKIHSELDNGYFEWNVGIACKGFAINRFNRKVE